ncbi:MAG TPA: VTT domain-containing protein [Burkholderiaceae bacterium]|nr:VTT domain-containing protein [Burkholderiaceae bacterium]
MQGIHWLDLFGAVDRFLLAAAHEHGAFAYGLLFLIIFAETGLVFMAFLPGDSLLFVSGAIAAGGVLQAVPLGITIAAAAVLGNAVNFAIGWWLGHKIYDGSIRWINRASLDRTHAFFERHGGKTVVAARFVPVVRSFAPLVAGASGMSSRRFHLFSVVGAVLWSVLLVGGGYAFGNVALIRDHLGLVLLVGLAGAFGPLALMALARLLRGRVRS